MSIYKKIDFDIPHNKEVDIPYKNNNQQSVPVNVPPNEVYNKSFSSETVKDHVSTNNKNVDIPKNRCRHTSK